MQVIHDLDVPPGRFEAVYMAVANWIQVDQDRGFKRGDWAVLNRIPYESGPRSCECWPPYVGRIAGIETLPDQSVLLCFEDTPCNPIQTE